MLLELYSKSKQKQKQKKNEKKAYNNYANLVNVVVK